MATKSNHDFKLHCPHGAQHQSGSVVTFSCQLSPEISAVDKEIRWFKQTRCVCLCKKGKVIEGRGYEGRVSLHGELERGNVSLQLRESTESDLGHYLCQVTDGVRTEELALGALMNVDTDSSHFVYISQIDRKWTEEEKIKMEESVLLTEYISENQRLNNDLKERSNKLKEAEEELRITRLNLNSVNKSLENKDRQLKERKTQIEDKDTKLGKREKIIKDKDALLEDRNLQLKKTSKDLEERDQQLELKDAQIQEARIQTEEKEKRLVQKEKELKEKNEQLKKADDELGTSKNHVETLGQELQNTKRQLQEMMVVLEQQKTEITEKNKQLEEKESLLTERGAGLMEKASQVHPDSSSPVKRRKSLEGLPPFMGGESSTTDSSLPVPLPEMRLVLLGGKNSGKSAARNTILGSVKSLAATTSPSTQQSESTQGEVSGRKVSVVDTPDWFCAGLSLEKLRQDVGLCVHLSAPGPHAFLLVIPVKQPTGEERGMLEKMEKIFGERCWRNTMIIFSVTDELQKKNIEEFIQSGEQEVQRVVEKCGKRFHCLNIKESGDGSQVSELLEKIEKMVEGSREKFYSSEIYLETESQIKAMETKILKEREEKRMREEMEMKEKIEREVQESLRKIEGVIKEHEGDIRQLNDRTTELERKMKEERDEEKKRELERELKREVEQRAEMEEKVKKLKEKRERERREMEERHQQEMEEIREAYEGEVRMETERNIMKVIMPEIQRNFLVSKTKMQEEFSRQMEEKDRQMEEKDRQMEEKDREMETLKQKLSELAETHSVLEEVYENEIRRSSGPERGETSKGISQRFKDFFH